MAEVLQELLIKVGVDVDDSNLEKTRKEMKELQEEGKKAAEYFKNTSTASKNTGSSNSAQQNLMADNSEILDVLTKSQKNLFELLDVVKKDSKKSDTKSPSGGKNVGGLGLINNVVEANTGTLVGGAIGGGAGAIFGGAGGALAGAQFGSQLGGLAQKIFEKVNAKLSLVAQEFDNRLEQDNHLRQLSFQTGKSVESLYKLQQQAYLAGTSLENVVNSAQDLTDEMFGGLDEKKAQIYMALGINPRNLIAEAKGDPEKAMQKIYEEANKTLKNIPAYQRTSLMKQLGFSENDQDARRRLYTKDFSDRAEEVKNKATKNGLTQFRNNEELNSDNLSFRGALLDLSASIRSALTADSLAKTLSTNLIEVKSDVINMVTSAVINLTGATSYNNTSRYSLGSNTDFSNFDRAITKPQKEMRYDEYSNFGSRDRAFDLQNKKEIDYGKFSGFGSNDRAFNSQNAKAVGQ